MATTQNSDDATLHVNGKQLPLDAEGFLRNMADWSPQAAQSLAQNEQIILTKEHFEIINILRDFYLKYELSPAMRVLVKQVKLQLGNDKASSIYLMKLFPGSPAKLASKIAGLPKPTNCL